MEKYQTATEAEKQEMEARYGKKQLETLVNNALSECWVQDNSKRCPKCNIVIEVWGNQMTKHDFFFD